MHRGRGRGAYAERMRRILFPGLYVIQALLGAAACSSSSGSVVDGGSSSDTGSGGGIDGGGDGAANGSDGAGNTEGGGNGDGGACGGSGTITVNYQQTPYSASCWKGGTDASGSTGDIGDGLPPAGSLAVQVNFNAMNVLTGKPCMFQMGATFDLTDFCIDIAVGLEQGNWKAVGGAGASGITPAPTGTLTISAWSAQNGGSIGISFSQNAALVTQDPGNVLVPIVGTAMVP
jgi:hypothetical protein